MKTYFIYVVVLFSLASSVGASQIKKILAEGELRPEHLSLFMDDGEIVHVEAKKRDLVRKARIAHLNQYAVELGTVSFVESEASVLRSIKLVPNSNKKQLSRSTLRRDSGLFSRLADEDEAEAKVEEDYSKEPPFTNVGSYKNAKRLMKTLKSKTDKDSQCYNRAHLWTYEASQLHSVNLGKIWLLFTRKYIREYNFKWWFHVAPMTKVKRQIFVLDRKYTKVPFNIDNWKNIFVTSKKSCTVTNDYLDFENNQENGHCYMMFTNPFYYNATDLINTTSGGRGFAYFDNEITAAYRDALYNWNGQIPGRKVVGDDFLLKLGEKVITNTGQAAKIVRLKGESVYVKFSGQSREALRHKAEIGTRRGDIEGIRYGQSVLGLDNKEAKVLGLFMDGYLGIKYLDSGEFSILHINNVNTL